VFPAKTICFYRTTYSHVHFALHLLVVFLLAVYLVFEFLALLWFTFHILVGSQFTVCLLILSLIVDIVFN